MTASSREKDKIDPRERNALNFGYLQMIGIFSLFAKKRMQKSRCNILNT